MFAAIPANAMAETLCVLAGTNASNAARHFTKRSYDSGDVASAILWSSILQTLERMVRGTAGAEEEPLVQPMPKRMIQLLESAAFQSVRFEDVDADVLAREESQDASEPDALETVGLEVLEAGGVEVGEIALPSVETEAKEPAESAQAEILRGPRTWTAVPGPRTSRPIVERVVKHSSRRIPLAA